MSTEGQFTTFADLYTGVLNMIRAQTSQAALVSQCKRAVNVALQDMHLGTEYQFYWAERSGTLLTQQSYTTGTIHIVQGFTGITGTGTEWVTPNAFLVNNMRPGGKIVIGGDQTVYEVSTVSTNTAATLSTEFVASTVSGASYTYFEDTYSLASDYLRPVDMRFFDDDLNIRFEDRRTLRRLFPRNDIPGRPRLATMIELGPSGSTALRPRLVLYPPPNSFWRIPYTYITKNLAVSSSGTLQEELSADTDEPIVPKRYRHAIYYYALMMMYEHKDDVRRAEAKAQYDQIMQRTLQDVSVGDRRTYFQPDVGHYYARAERPYTGRSRHPRWDFNNDFDRRR